MFFVDVSNKCYLIKSIPVLSDGLLSFEGVLGPDSLRVDELALPWLNVPIQVRNQLVFFMAHSRPEVGDTHICLLGPPGGEGGELKLCLLNEFTVRDNKQRACILTAGLTVE